MQKIFLSSTAKDLGGCCAELARGINALKGWHCVWMEDFYASDSTSVEYCQKRVQECDVYIGVIGPLCGSCPTGSEISFTQHEYEAAITKGMPRLIFQTEEHFLVPANLIELDEKRDLQQKFRQRLRRERMVNFFSSSGRLNELVIGSLNGLVEETVMSPQPCSPGADIASNLGPAVHQLCDRGPQEDVFTSFFVDKVREMPGIPQIYIVHGEERENIDSLINRICTITIEKQLIRELNLPREPVKCRLVEWPDPDSPSRKKSLVRRLFAKIVENETYVGKNAQHEKYDDLEPATFVKLRLLTSGGVLALKHEIRERRWTSKASMLIDWYCRFWDEVAAKHPVRQILVFLSILYPDGTKENHWKSLLPFSLAFGPVERDLIELQNLRQRESERNPRMCPIARLPELRCLRDHHLMDWFSTNGICELHERERHRARLFAKRRCLHMAHLEAELKKIVTGCRNERL